MRALGRATIGEDDPRATDGTAYRPARLRYREVESIPLRGFRVPCGARATRCARPHAMHTRRVTMTCRRPGSRSKRPNADQPGGQYVRRAARLGFQPPPNEARESVVDPVPGVTGRSLRRRGVQCPPVPKTPPDGARSGPDDGAPRCGSPPGCSLHGSENAFHPTNHILCIRTRPVLYPRSGTYLNRHCDNAATLIAETVTTEARHSPVVPWRSLRV